MFNWLRTGPRFANLELSFPSWNIHSSRVSTMPDDTVSVTLTVSILYSGYLYIDNISNNLSWNVAEQVHMESRSDDGLVRGSYFYEDPNGNPNQVLYNNFSGIMFNQLCCSALQLFKWDLRDPTVKTRSINEARAFRVALKFVLLIIITSRRPPRIRREFWISLSFNAKSQVTKSRNHCGCPVHNVMRRKGYMFHQNKTCRPNLYDTSRDYIMPTKLFSPILRRSNI